MPGMAVELIGLTGIPLVRSGDDLVALTFAGLERSGLSPRAGDVLAFAQKIVSKAEGRCIALADVVPGERALELARITEKDPRLVELILGESTRVVRAARDVVIVEHRLGLIMANAGIDQSNVNEPGGAAQALLLPVDPDGSARRLQQAISRQAGCHVGVVICDSFGRPWRIGTVGVAIGVAGLQATHDLRGSPDLLGRTMQVTVVGHGDEIASAASLVMGQAGEGLPIVLVRGLPPRAGEQPAAALIRDPSEDLFR